MVQLRMAFAFLSFSLLLNGCSRDALPLDAPENELISRVKVLRKGTLIQEVRFEYDNLNRIKLMDISQLEGASVRELVRYQYTDNTVQMKFSFVFDSGEEDAFDLILHKDTDGYIIAFKTINSFQTDTQNVSVIRDTEKYMINAVDIAQGNVLNEYRYDEFGLLQTNLLNSLQGYHRKEIIEYDLLESFAPGVNDIPVLTELSRDGYPFQPPYLLHTGFISNPSPRFLPKTRTTSLDDEFTNRQVFSFDYARDKKGRIVEVRKYSPDLLNDVRMLFEYVKKR
jgi:hypothetical protein